MDKSRRQAIESSFRCALRAARSPNGINRDLFTDEALAVVDTMLALDEAEATVTRLRGAIVNHRDAVNTGLLGKGEQDSVDQALWAQVALAPAPTPPLPDGRIACAQCAALWGPGYITDHRCGNCHIGDRLREDAGYHPWPDSVKFKHMGGVRPGGVA